MVCTSTSTSLRRGLGVAIGWGPACDSIKSFASCLSYICASNFHLYGLRNRKKVSVSFNSSLR